MAAEGLAGVRPRYRNQVAPPAEQPQWARECREELGQYFLAINPNYEYVDYQQEKIIPALEAFERGEFDRLMIFVPAGHAKTDIATKAFTPWFLGRNQNHNEILLCHTDPLAKDFGSAIRNTMTRNPAHLAIFPELQIDNANHAANFFRTNRGNTFYAFGMDGGFTGRRADLITIEDPCKNWQDAFSEPIQSNQFETYKGVVKDRLRPGGKILLIQTRWQPRDLAGRILEAEANRWKVLVLPAEETDAEGNGTGKFLWESFFGREKYLEAKEDLYIWNSKWQQSPQPRMAQGFQTDWLRFYLPKTAKPEYRTNEDGSTTLIGAPVDYDKLFKFNTYILVDPAMGKEAAHDRTAILVLAAGPDHRLFWVDGVLDRMDPGERIDALIRLVRLWDAQQVIFEEYALQADSYFLRLAFEKDGLTDVVVTSVGRKGVKGMTGGRLKKTDRIMQLVPDFRDGRIWIPRRMKRKLLDGTEMDLVKYFVEDEFLPWAGEGSTAHDDILDCMSRIHDPDLSLNYAEREVEHEADEHAYSSGSWESSL